MHHDVDRLRRSTNTEHLNYNELGEARRQEEAIVRWPLLLATKRIYDLNLNNRNRATTADQLAAHLWEVTP